MPFIIKPRRVLGVALSLAALAVGAAPAQAADPSPSTRCVAPALKQAFLPFGDTATYTLSPGGDFESGARDWTLTGGARVVAGNEPFFLGRSTDRSSLSMPVGSSVTSAPICVGVNYPFSRMVARASAANSTLLVEVRYLDAAGTVRSQPVGQIAAGTSWAPTRRFANAIGLTSGGGTSGMKPISYRFTALSGTWQIDDLYVDPWARG